MPPVSDTSWPLPVMSSQYKPFHDSPVYTAKGLDNEVKLLHVAAVGVYVDDDVCALLGDIDGTDVCGDATVVVGVVVGVTVGMDVGVDDGL